MTVTVTVALTVTEIETLTVTGNRNINSYGNTYRHSTQKSVTAKETVTATATVTAMETANQRGSIFNHFSVHADGERRGLGTNRRVQSVSVRRIFRCLQIDAGPRLFAVGVLRDIAKKTGRFW